MALEVTPRIPLLPVVTPEAPRLSGGALSVVAALASEMGAYPLIGDSAEEAIPPGPS